MNYTLHQLQIFIKVAEMGSITKAADALHLTQPAVSIQLKNFQHQFDIPLYEVIGKQFYITDFGREIANVAANILAEAEAIEQKSMQYKGLLAGNLKVSVVSTGKYVMPYFLTDFIKMHPQIMLTMDVTNKQKVLDSLRQNTVDFSLVSIVPDELTVNKIELLENQLYLVANADMAGRYNVEKVADMENLPMIFREQGSGTRQSMENYFYRNGLKVRKTLELATNEAVKQAVLAGLGFSIMPIIGIKNEILNKEIQIIPMQGLPIKTHWQLIWDKEKKLTPVAHAFLTHINEHKNKLANTHFRSVMSNMDG